MENRRTHRAACAYISSDHQPPQQQADVIHQSRRIASHCARGLLILSTTVVEPMFGEATPERDRLLERILSPGRPFDQLIVTSLTKLSRDPALLAPIVEALKSADIELIVLDKATHKMSAPMTVERL